MAREPKSALPRDLYDRQAPPSEGAKQAAFALMSARCDAALASLQERGIRRKIERLFRSRGKLRRWPKVGHTFCAATSGVIVSTAP